MQHKKNGIKIRFKYLTNFIKNLQLWKAFINKNICSMFSMIELNQSFTLVFFQLYMIKIWYNCIVGVMVSMLTSSAVDRGFEHGRVKPKTLKLVFGASPLRRNSKDCLAWNQDNVSEWDDVSIGGLLFQWANTVKIQCTIKIQRSLLV
jgi:hypothetical protein